MEGIDEMWMPCEYRRPYKVPVLGEPYSMYGGWSRTEQGAADRDPLHAADPEHSSAACLLFRQFYPTLLDVTIGSARGRNPEAGAVEAIHQPAGQAVVHGGAKSNGEVGRAVLARQQMSHPLGGKDSQTRPCPEACCTVFCSIRCPAPEPPPHGSRRALSAC